MVLLSMSSSFRLMNGKLLLLEKCMPHLGPSTSHGQILVLAGLGFSPSLDELKRSSSPGHGHFLCMLQESSLFYGC